VNAKRAGENVFLIVGDVEDQLAEEGLRALGVADERIPPDVAGRASVYRSLLRDRQALVVLDNAGSEEQVRPLLPGGGTSKVLITARRLLAGYLALWRYVRRRARDSSARS